MSRITFRLVAVWGPVGGIWRTAEARQARIASGCSQIFVIFKGFK